ncbi:DUF6890 family protein [Actinobacillus porcinus]|uniref:DUF6890 family protein n=1 Tax=Actinobacillus porcinus TaxID=51048 RepID=UPI0039C67732
MTDGADAIDNNGLSQALALRRYYLPQESDDTVNLSRAVWLHRQYFEQMANAVAAGIAKVL